MYSFLVSTFWGVPRGAPRFQLGQVVAQDLRTVPAEGVFERFRHEHIQVEV